MAKGMLYIVGTPIGNLGDMSSRALEVLGEADRIAAEDTRHTRKLLTHFEISKPMISYHDHNRKKVGDQLLHYLEEGETIALVSDAGMPAVSDPGEDLVKLCIDHDIEVTTIPGPTAFVSALILSGLSTLRFSFEGFLDRQKKKRRDQLEALKYDQRTLIFYEAPHRLTDTLKDMELVLGDRQAAAVREITKRYEEAIRLPLSEMRVYFGENKPKGEFVLVVDGAPEDLLPPDTNPLLDLSLEDHIRHYLKEGLRRKEVAAKVAEERGLNKKEVYKLSTTVEIDQ